MKCCKPYILPFTGQASTVINYTDELKSNYGQFPTVEVYYREPPSGEHIKAEVPVSLSVPVTEVRIDHGGIMSGFVKISA